MPYPIYDWLFYFFTSSPLELILRTAFFLGPSRNEEVTIMYQPVLFDLKDIFDKPLRRYELFSSILDLTCMEKSLQVGRKPISRAALTRALIFKNLRSIATLSDLSAELYERSRLASILGFEPKEKPVPVERFSSYLKDDL